MKRPKIDIKKTILKRIENRGNEHIFINGKRNMDAKRSIILNEKIIVDKKTNVLDENFLLSYHKKSVVNYDVVICIPSYNRYKKVKRLISQFYEQPTKYTFKIILLSDCSTGAWYDKLTEYFPEIIYIKNKKRNGKASHWYCYNQMWNYLKTIECHAVLQMDDDFILCNNFLNIIIDLYFRKKDDDNKIMAIAPHTWSFNKIDANIKPDKYTIDGIGLFDYEFIKAINYELKPVNNASNTGASAGAWSQFINMFKQYNYYVYRTEKSLVWHDGNDDSKLHPNFRNNRGIYTQNFVDNRNYD